ncbi:SDR family NAD(P)-dependent oxidoreductase [Cellulosimicrobium cellulans]|uniref:SDR family NAD(P)-dependent oxidoreductase n=1 Tax=Cellulosimicrobium cellulans TaxID=1710 RepID=UPI000848A377|nr:SDR family NAD(P)-dependent oxidoreductase [Cellulosimicrobium cellulans]
MAVAPTRPLAVLTGATGGIGRALADTFVRHGFDLLVSAHDDGVDALPAELTAPPAHRIHGPSPQAAQVVPGAVVTAVRADLTTSDGVRALVAAVRGRGRPVDVLALNAGAAHGGAFVESSLQGDLDVVALNVTATVHLAKELVPAMVERGAGRVLITASTAAAMPGPWFATYAASKSFLVSFGAALRHELRGTGVTVTTFLPGPADTALFVRSGMGRTRVGRGTKDSASTVAATAFRGLMAGRATVVMRSIKPVLQVVAGAVLPRRLAAVAQAVYTSPRPGPTS